MTLQDLRPPGTKISPIVRLAVLGHQHLNFETGKPQDLLGLVLNLTFQQSQVSSQPSRRKGRCKLPNIQIAVIQAVYKFRFSKPSRGRYTILVAFGTPSVTPATMLHCLLCARMYTTLPSSSNCAAPSAALGAVRQAFLHLDRCAQRACKSASLVWMWGSRAWGWGARPCLLSGEVALTDLKAVSLSGKQLNELVRVG